MSGQKFDQRISAWPPSPHAERVPIAIGRGRRNSKIASSSRRDWCHILMRGYLYFYFNSGIIAERNHTDDLLVQAMTKDLQPGLPLRSRRGNEGEEGEEALIFVSLNMKLTLYQIDAFTNKLFGGNPAAVVPLDKWIDDELMQKLGMENNLSETVFFAASPSGGGQERAAYEIRWFTPSVEINLCGHATLASAFVLYNFLGYNKPKLVFDSKSGKLEIEKRGDLYVMDFPAWKPERIYNYHGNLRQALGVDEIMGIYKHRDLLVELNKEEDVREAKPNFSAIKKWEEKVIITARGTADVDFVSRFFAPSAGVDEDPVTGSAHSQLIPFWSEKLGKKKMHAKQLSKRGGELWVADWGDRVSIAGQCVFYMKGEISLQ